MFLFHRLLVNCVFAPDGGGGAPPAPAAAPPAAVTAPAGATPPAGGAPTPTPPAGAAPVFAETLPADLREMALFKDIKDLDGLARSYAGAAKMVGMDKGRIVALPAEGDEAGFAELYAKLGRPEAPDKYGFKPPEGITVDAKLQEGFAKTAHQLGLNVKQAEGLYAWWNGEGKAAGEVIAARNAQALQAGEAALKTEFGAAYTQNMDLAHKALAHYGTPALNAELEHTGDGNRPEVVKMFAKLGRQLSEDGILGKGGGGGDQLASPTEAKQQINALRADKGFSAAYNNSRDPGHADAVARMQKLYEQAHPTIA